jgi:hypothetical protein
MTADARITAIHYNIRARRSGRRATDPFWHRVDYEEELISRGPRFRKDSWLVGSWQRLGLSSSVSTLMGDVMFGPSLLALFPDVTIEGVTLRSSKLSYSRISAGVVLKF